MGASTSAYNARSVQALAPMGRSYDVRHARAA